MEINRLVGGQRRRGIRSHAAFPSGLGGDEDNRLNILVVVVVPMNNVAGPGCLFLQSIAVLQVDKVLIRLIPIRQHGLLGGGVFLPVFLIRVGNMEVTGGRAHLLQGHPLLPKAGIFLLAAALLLFFMVALHPFRRGMPHAVSLAVTVIAEVAVGGIAVFIRRNGVTDVVLLGFRGHAVYIHLARRAVRLPFRVAILVNLG